MRSSLQRCCRPQERLPIAGVASVHFCRGCGWIIALPLTLYSLGLGLASAQVTGTVFSEIPVNSSGQASATQSTVRQVDSALGTAVSGSVFPIALGLTLPKTLEKAGIMGPGAAGIAEATRQSAGSAIAELRVQGGHSPFSEQTSVVVQALSDGMIDAARYSLLAASAFLALGFISAMRVLRAANESSSMEQSN